jgi:hypothetical protein
MTNSSFNSLDYLLVPYQDRNDDGELGNGGYCVTMLTPAIAQKGSENEMWNLYLNEVKEDDQAMADVWKQDAKGILVFVCLNRLAQRLFF